MISASSNCSRIDAVKASANQLKIQTVKPSSTKETDSADASASKVKSDIQTLDDSIKSGDAKKAELALSNVKSDVRKQDSDTAGAKKEPEPGPDGSGFRRFLAYA